MIYFNINLFSESKKYICISINMFLDFLEYPYNLFSVFFLVLILSETIKYFLLHDELRYHARNRAHNEELWRQQQRRDIQRNILATDRKRRIGG